MDKVSRLPGHYIQYRSDRSCDYALRLVLRTCLDFPDSPDNFLSKYQYRLALSRHLLYILSRLSGQNSKKLTRSSKKDLNIYYIGLRITPDQCLRGHQDWWPTRKENPEMKELRPGLVDVVPAPANSLGREIYHQSLWLCGSWSLCPGIPRASRGDTSGLLCSLSESCRYHRQVNWRNALAHCKPVLLFIRWGYTRMYLQERQITSRGYIGRP